MRIRNRVAAVGASIAIAGGGMLGVVTPASASIITPDFSCQAWHYERGAHGHGASITCYGSSFIGYTICHQPDGHTYIAFGNRARSDGTSTTWCDRDAEVIDAGAFPV
ncbi:hypothetical protein [Streptomyces sp. NPDC001719]